MPGSCRIAVSAAAGFSAALMAVLRPLATPLLRLSRLARLRSLVRGVVPVTTQFDGPARAVKGARVHLGEHCRLGRDVLLETPGQGRIDIGSHVRVNQGAIIEAASHVAIGDDCLIAEYVSIRDAGHGMAPGVPMRLQDQESSPIVVGRDVWIGRGTAVLRGVTIGDGAVIGANSVVTKDIPPGAVAVGAPAAVIRTRGAPVSSLDDDAANTGLHRQRPRPGRAPVAGTTGPASVFPVSWPRQSDPKE